MDIVTQEVKRLILSCFTIMPTRIHALIHMTLTNGTGYDWVQCSESGLYIVKSCFSYDNPSSIERVELKPELNLDGQLDFSVGDAFYNHIAQFVEANIDLYASSAFYSQSLNLNPRKPYKFSRGYNKFCNLPPIDMIHPDWLGALVEVADHEMQMRNPLGCSLPKAQIMDIMVRDHYEWVDGFKILSNFKDKYTKFKGDVDFGFEFETPLETRYKKSKYANQLTLEEYKEYREFFENSRDYTFIDFERWLTSVIENKAKYLDSNGRANQKFHEDAQLVLTHDGVLNHYNSFKCMEGQIKSGLKLNSYFEGLIKTYVHDNGMFGLLGY
ncbi:hypothetical protein GOP96_06580 [Vibrio cholerae]|nr:hypothetical protein [Vibrio cholerae]